LFLVPVVTAVVCVLLQNRDRARANAAYYCERLGRYRMPFAWTAVYLMNVITSANSLDAENEQQQSHSDSLGQLLLLTCWLTVTRLSSHSEALGWWVATGLRGMPIENRMFQVFLESC